MHVRLVWIPAFCIAEVFAEWGIFWYEVLRLGLGWSLGVMHPSEKIGSGHVSTHFVNVVSGENRIN